MTDVFVRFAVDRIRELETALSMESREKNILLAKVAVHEGISVRAAAWKHLGRVLPEIEGY